MSDGGQGFVNGDTILAEGASVFRGEELRNASASTKPAANAATNGDTNLTTSLIHIETGEQLEGTIPQDATLRAYTSDGNVDGANRVNLRQAIINDFDVENPNGAAVSGGTLVNDGTSPNIGFVNATYNFNESEPLEVTVTDADGLDVTSEIVTGTNPDTSPSSGTATITFDSDNVDTGEYTFTVEGEDELDFGAATQSTTVTVSDSLTPELELASTSVVQGE
ncbi:MAG: hypothetical protein RI560_13710, partial [Natronomonas sp.]|nr:hypothetical protein [Natronomonas sp.]